MKMKLEEYIEWMYDNSNEFNCSECPENQDMEGEQHRHPCGQQNCWVSCHCKNI